MDAPALVDAGIRTGPPDTDVALRMYGVRPQFVGRQPALKTLYEAARQATRTGELQQVVVQGPKGIGKTRLCHELIDLIEGGGHPLLALRAVASEGVSSGFGLVDQLVRRRFHVEPGAADDVVAQRLRRGLIGSAPEAEQARWASLLGCLVGLPAPTGDRDTDGRAVRERAVAAFGTLLATEARARPVILVLDALQWVDIAGLEMLRGLVARLQGAAALAIFVTRAANPRAALVAEAPTTRLRLAALDEPSCLQVAASLLGGADVADIAPLAPIVDTCGGNPGELVRRVRYLLKTGAVQLEESTLTINLRELELPPEGAPAPDGADRLAGLSQADREVLECAAVFGEHFWFDGVLSLLWSARPEPRGVGQADRIALALHHTLLGLLRRDLVRFVAGAGQHGEVASSVPGTDELAFARSDDRKRLLEEGDPDHLQLLRGWAGRWMLAARATDAQRWLLRIGHILDESDRGDLAIEAWCRAGEEALRRGREDLAVAAFEHVLATTEDDDEQRARAQAGLADIHERSRNHAEALEAWTELLRWARILGERRLAARAEVAQGRLLERLGRTVEAREVLARASSRCEELGLGDDRATSEEVLARLAGAEGTAVGHRAALGHLRHALVLWQQLGREDAAARVQASMATHLLGAGEIGEARLAAQKARDGHGVGSEGTYDARVLHLLGCAAAAAGEIEEALGLWTDALTTIDTGAAPDLEATVLANLSDAHLLLGEPERARARADAALALSLQLESGRLEGRARHRRSAVLRHQGHLSEAREEAASALRLATEAGDVRLAAMAQRATAEVDARDLARRVARAEVISSHTFTSVGNRLRDACRQAEAVGDRSGTAQALESYATYLDAAGAGHKCRKVRLRAEGLRAQLRADWERAGADAMRSPPTPLTLPSMDELERVARRAAESRFGEPFHD